MLESVKHGSSLHLDNRFIFREYDDKAGVKW